MSTDCLKQSVHSLAARRYKLRPYLVFRQGSGSDQLGKRSPAAPGMLSRRLATRDSTSSIRDSSQLLSSLARHRLAQRRLICDVRPLSATSTSAFGVCFPLQFFNSSTVHVSRFVIRHFS